VTARTIHDLRLLALALPLACACGSTGVGNPYEETGSLSLAIVSDDADGNASTDTTALEPLPRGALTRALIVFGSVSWLPCDPELDAVTQSGPFIVDLLAGETRPALPELALPRDGFCGFDAVLAPARDAADVAGRSLLFAGQRADGVRFLLFADLRATLRVRAADGDTWGAPREKQTLLWGMRPRRWASPQELADEEPSQSTGGTRTLVIDADRHPLLFALIRARLASQSGLFFDADRNGALDAAERSAGAIGSAAIDDE